jgi:hypothetical protein
MKDVSVIPDEDIVNGAGLVIGSQVRTLGSPRGYTPSSSDDAIIVKLTEEETPIAIGSILLTAQNFVSATLFVKTADDDQWKLYTTLTKLNTTFDSLIATQLKFQFPANTKYIKIGIIGCFPPAGNEPSNSRNIRD